MKRKRTLALSVFLLVCVSVFVFSSGGKEQSSAATGERHEWTTEKGTFVLSQRIADKVANGETLVFRNSTYNAGTPFFADVNLGIKQSVKEFNIDNKLIGPIDVTVEGQVAQLETLFMAEAIDGLAVSCNDADIMMPLFDLAWGKGIPVITYDGDSPESKRLAYVGSSHYKIGRMGGEELMRLHPTKTGKLVTFPAFPEGLYARGRMQGFFDILKENNYKLDVIGPFGVGLDTSEGYGVVESAFAANPDIEIVYNPEEFVVVPAAYVKRNNLKDNVIVIGVNALPEILQLVQEGYIDQTTDIDPMGQGYTAAKILFEFITTGKTTEEIILLDPISITKKNVDEIIKSKQ